MTNIRSVESKVYYIVTCLQNFGDMCQKTFRTFAYHVSGEKGIILEPNNTLGEFLVNILKDIIALTSASISKLQYYLLSHIITEGYLVFPYGLESWQ